MSNHVIWPLPLCEFEPPKIWWTYRYDWFEKGKGKAYIWFIEGPKERIIFDTGGTSKEISGSIPDFVCKDVASPEEALSKVGLKCEDIDIVIIGHVHPDHMGLSYKYPNAKFVIQRKELEFARNPHPAVGTSYRKEWLEGVNFEVIDGDNEIVPGISVIFTPGHSPGGQSLAVQTEKGIAIITGFCVVGENFNPPKQHPYPVMISLLHTNAIELYDSLMKVKEKADIVLPVHEFDLPERIP